MYRKNAVKESLFLACAAIVRWAADIAGCCMPHSALSATASRADSLGATASAQGSSKTRSAHTVAEKGFATFRMPHLV